MTNDVKDDPRLNVYLPKWPQMLVTGDDVTHEQAREIILRTDTFLTAFGQYYGGNDHLFNARYRHAAGLDVYEDRRGAELDALNKRNWRLQMHAQEKLDELLGVIDTEYVHNRWASCAFIHGPHGWCSPAGKIDYVDNVGKWPAASDIMSDWEKIAAAFPFVRARVTLMSGEDCEDGTVPRIAFQVADGEVSIVEPDMTLHASMPRRTTGDLIDVLTLPVAVRERGLPDEWIDAYAKRVRAAVEEACRYAESVEKPDNPV